MQWIQFRSIAIGRRSSKKKGSSFEIDNAYTVIYVLTYPWGRRFGRPGQHRYHLLSPLLWNAFNNRLLQLNIPDGVHLVAFAHDVAVVAVARNTELMEVAMKKTLKIVNQWMLNNGLHIASHKSGSIVLIRKWAYRYPALHIGGHPIAVNKAIYYLGVRLNTWLTYKEHLLSVWRGSKKAAVILCRLMSNVSGPN